MKNTGTAVEFWDTIKLCLQDQKELISLCLLHLHMDMVRILHFQRLSENCKGLEEIRFTADELEKYIKDYCSKNFGLSNDHGIISKFNRYIQKATVGHVGLVRHILHHTKNAMANRIRNNELTWKRIFVYLNSDIFSGSIDDCRATPRVDRLSEGQKKICRDIYLQGTIIFSDSEYGRT